MFIARFNIEARFGHKQKVIELMKQWDKEIGSQIGWKDDKIRSLTGSIAAKESLVQQELTLASIAELEQGFQKLANVKEHAQWGKELEEHVVSGSNVWEILRVIEA